MALEKIEEQIDMVLHRVRQLQTKVTEFQKQAKSLAQEGELSARESLHKVFDNGLTLLGKGIISGRKATESFVAETHRKAKKFKDAEVEEVAATPTEVMPAPKKASKVNPEKNLSAKAQARKLRAKSKKPVNHHTSSARSH